MTALRAFSPDMIICDEIGSEEDACAIECSANSGVQFAASIHAADKKELFARPQFRRLADTGAFDCVAILNDSKKPCTIREFVELKGNRDENIRDAARDGVLYDRGKVLQRSAYAANQGA